MTIENLLLIDLGLIIAFIGAFAYDYFTHPSDASLNELDSETIQGEKR